MRRRPFLRPHFALVLVLATAVAGCSGRPISTAPEPRAARGAEPGKSRPEKTGSGKGFFPLTPGNRWEYHHQLRILLVPVTGPPVVLSAREQDVLRELVCVETRGDREYVVERETITEPGRTFVTWIRSRQDRAGLYEAEIDNLEPPACEPAGAPGGVRSRSAPEPHEWSLDPGTIADSGRLASYAAAIAEIERKHAATRHALRGDRGAHATRAADEGELTRLRYPLRRNQSWTIHTDPDFSARVEGHESLALPVGKRSGWRVRLHGEFYGPKDFALYWYSREGVLQFREGFEAEVRGPGGVPTGERIVGMGGETLVRYSLVRPDRRAAAEAGNRAGAVTATADARADRGRGGAHDPRATPQAVASTVTRPNTISLMPSCTVVHRGRAGERPTAQRAASTTSAAIAIGGASARSASHATPATASACASSGSAAPAGAPRSSRKRART